MNQRQLTRPLLAILALIFVSGELKNQQLPISSRAATAPFAASTTNAQYKIDSAQSKFIVRAFTGGLLSAFAGHDHTVAIREFSGVTDFTYGTVEPASLAITIKAGSLAITDKVSEKDKQAIEATMRDEVLQVSNFPEISFKSTSISASKTAEAQYQARINGDITLRGVTKPLLITARLEFGNNSLRAQGGFNLKQTSFGIKPVSVAGGTVKVKDELKFTFDIVAHP